MRFNSVPDIPFILHVPASNPSEICPQWGSYPDRPLSWRNGGKRSVIHQIAERMVSESIGRVRYVWNVVVC